MWSRGCPILASVLLGALLNLLPVNALRADGYWELMSSKLYMPEDRIGDTYEAIGRTKSGTFVCRTIFKDRNTKKEIDSQIISWSWSKFPRFLVPGMPLRNTLRAVVTYKPRQDVGIVYSWAAVVTEAWTANGWQQNGEFLDSRGRGEVRHATWTKQGEVGELETTAGIRAGTPGAKTAITVIVEQPSQVRWLWRYEYIWKEGSPPADARGDMIAPAVEWDGRRPFPRDVGQRPDDRKNNAEVPDKQDPDDDNNEIPDRDESLPTDPQTNPPSDVQSRTLWAPKRVVRAGQRVLVPIWLLRPDGVANIDFDITYDPSVVVPERDVVKGSLLSRARLEANNRSSGVIKVAFAQTTPLTADGIVVNLPLRVVGKAGQRTPLELSVSDIDDVDANSLPIKLIDGEIIIQSPDQATRGDCDGDGELTVADAICALKMAVDLMPLDMNMDINGDGKVTSGDAREILQRIP